MAAVFAIDTNLYVGALRNPPALRALQAFLLRAGPRIHLSAVVVMELRAGARTRSQQAALSELVAPYAERDRLLVPSFDAYAQAGRVLAALAVTEHLAAPATAPSFVNDVMIATSCREAGVTLVTANHDDFARIRRHLRGFQVASPWPGGLPA